MNRESKAMEELHKIRERLYEETKDLSPEEWVASIEKEAAEARKKYGLNLPRLSGAKKRD